MTIVAATSGIVAALSTISKAKIWTAVAKCCVLGKEKKDLGKGGGSFVLKVGDFIERLELSYLVGGSARVRWVRVAMERSRFSASGLLL